jgi:Protein of unknown function (DUF2752)
MTSVPFPASAPVPGPGERRHAHEVRAAAGGMLAIAAAWPLLPLHPPVACPLRSLTGVPCPLCGMTRAVVAAAHGHLATSLAFNPGGVFVLLLAIAAVVRPAWLTRARLPLWSIFAVLGALWVWNIGFNPTFHQLLLR